MLCLFFNFLHAIIVFLNITMAYKRKYGDASKQWGMRRVYRPVPFKRRRGSRTAQMSAPRRRIRPRTGPSFTRTKTRRQKRGTRIATHGDNASSSFTRIGGSRMSRFLRMLMRKIIQKQTVVANSAANVTCGYGAQALLGITVLSKSTLITMETAGAGAATTNSVRLFLYGAKHTLTMRNQSNTNARCVLYDIVTRRDPPSTGLDTPGEAWAAGMTDYGATGAASVVGQTPFRSPEFSRLFSVKKVTTFHLEPGMTHEHIVQHKYNKLMSSVRFQNVAGTAAAGLTRQTLLVFYGTLAHESAAASTVTTSPITLDYMSRVEYTYGFIEKTTPSYAVTDNLVKTLTDPDAMLESGDVDANVIAA